MIVDFPLTHPQKRIWYTEKTAPNGAINNIGGTIRIKGTIHYELLEQAIRLFISKHEIFKFVFIEKKGELYQRVGDSADLKVDFFDFSVCDEPEKECEMWVRHVAETPFDWNKEKLYYFAIFKISDKDNGYLAKFHHIIADGWSTGIMTEQICVLYDNLHNNIETAVPPEPSYVEYIAQEQEYLKSDKFMKSKTFWMEKLAGKTASLIQNVDRSVVAGSRQNYELSVSESAKIRAYVNEHKASLNTFFISIYMVYVYKTLQQEEMVLGVPLLNRNGKLQRRMFGMFTSNMPFYFRISANESFSELLNRVDRELRKSYHHQKYPYDLLVQDLELKKYGGNNLFQAAINYYNTQHVVNMNGLPVDNQEFYNGNQLYPLQLVIKEWSALGNITLDIDYKASEFTDEQISKMYTRLTQLMDAITESPQRKISEISLLTEDELHAMNNMNNTAVSYPDSQTVVELFEEQVLRTPEATAVSSNGVQLSYRELNRSADNLANLLLCHNVQPGNIIGLLTTHSIETIIGMIGVLKSGAAVLPLDPEYPDERIRYMLEDSKSGILLSNLKTQDRDYADRYNIIDISESVLFNKQRDSRNRKTDPSGTAYVIYTSGTTGQPKGVVVKHKGLVNYVWWARQTYVRDEKEVFPLFTSLAFDLTITSIFTPLICGNKIVIPDEDKYGHRLLNVIRENEATVIKLTPSHLSLIQDMTIGKSKIKRFIVGGEELKSSLAKAIYEKFDGRVEIYNEYGPTEATVGCMIYQYDYLNDNNKVTVPIGVPIHNMQVYILDTDLKRSCPGTVGELYISGDGVADGYLDKPDITSGKFISNPFVQDEKMYKTGDRARFTEEGCIEYLGRIDTQVKLNGKRVELGEVEAVLEEHAAISRAIVLIRDGASGRGTLCAYIMQKEEVSKKDITAYLMRRLPDYMIPSSITVLDSMPLTVNGKLDTSQLPEPVQDSEHICSTDHFSLNAQVLTDTIKQILGLHAVKPEDNFYHLGGDSITAIQITSRLYESGLKIKVNDILTHPIIGDMVSRIEEDKSRKYKQTDAEGDIPVTPMISWFLSQQLLQPEHYNQSLYLDITPNVDAAMLEQVLNVWIRHHDSLRINYSKHTGRLFYNEELLSRRQTIKEYNLSELPASEQQEALVTITREMQAGFHLESDILIKACLLNLGNTRRLFIAAHHLVIDAVSWRILLDDMYVLLKQMGEGKEGVLPRKTSSYQDWANALEDYSSNIGQEELHYWLSAADESVSFAADYNMGPDTYGQADSITARLGEYETELLKTKTNQAYSTETRELLVTALLMAMKEFTENSKLVIELEGHGRAAEQDLDLTRTVGWFTSLYPFSIHLPENTVSDCIKTVKESLRRIPNQGFGYGLLKYLGGKIVAKEHKYIKFNYLGDFTLGLDNQYFMTPEYEVFNAYGKLNSFPNLIEINCFSVDRDLRVIITYSSNKFKRQTMQSFLSLIMENVKGVISHCNTKQDIEFTVSDFETANVTQEELDNLFI